MINTINNLFRITMPLLLAIFFLPFAAQASDYVPNEVIVEVEPGYRPALSYKLERFGASDVKAGSEFLILTINDSRTVPDTIEFLERFSRVKSAEPNYYAKLFVEEENLYPYATEPNDTEFSRQWHHEVSNGVKSTAAWDTETGDSSVVVAIVDSGMDTDHQDLDGNLWVNPGETAGNGLDDDSNGRTDDINGWDFRDNDNTPVPNPDGLDDDGENGIDDAVTHGTHVAGIVGAEGNNSEGVAGVMWDVQLMTLKVYDDDSQSSYSDISSAITYAVNNGADIINMSFGGYSNNGLLSAAISNAVSNDMILVAAVGNDGVNMNADPAVPVYPACYTGVIGVAASRSNGQAAGYSNYGSNCTDVTAPGSSIYSTLYTNDPTYSFTDDYGYLSGTSMASPVVAGVAALLLSQDNTLSPTAVENIIVDTAEDVGLSSAYGSGLVDAARAVGAVDCVAEDDSVTVPSYTYYQDDDADGLGDSTSYIYSCADSAPSGFVTDSTDANDDDADNDGVSTASDCNDNNNAISENQLYYADEDGDGVGNAADNQSLCSLTAPDGYTAESGDCNDTDATVSSETTYYIDEDGDGLGNPDSSLAACSVSAPNGYADNSNDTNDAVANANVEIDGDGIDNDGDGSVDEVNTIENNGAHPTFGSYDVSDSAQYTEAISTVKTKKNGVLQVTYADGSVYNYTVFDVTKKPLKRRFKKTGYQVVLHPKGRNLALVNVFNGTVVDTQKMSAKKKYKSSILRVVKLNGKKRVAAVSKRKGEVLVTVVNVRTKKGLFGNRSRVVVLQDSAKNIRVKRTAFKKKNIILRNKKKTPLLTFRVTKKGKVKFVE